MGMSRILSGRVGFDNGPRAGEPTYAEVTKDVSGSGLIVHSSRIENI